MTNLRKSAIKDIIQLQKMKRDIKFAKRTTGYTYHRNISETIKLMKAKRREGGETDE